MKKVLIGVAVFVVVLVAGVLIAPTFIDWNQYKGVITREVEQATGRSLEIGGDLSLSILPRAALMAEDVRLASLPGAAEPHTVRVETVEVRVDAGALLSGDVRVQSIRLVRPVVALERLEDGRATWEFAAATKDAAAEVVEEGTAADGGQDGGGIGLRLDQVMIEDGLVTFRDTRTGTEERVSAINAELSAETLRGPFRAEGSMTARDVPLFVKAVVGQLGDERASQVSAEVALQEASATGRFNGLLTSPSNGGGSARSIRGDLTLTASDLYAAAKAFGQDLPTGMAAPFQLSGELAVSPQTAGIEGLRIALADTEATGAASIDHAAQPRKAAVKLAFGAVNADRWMAPTPATAEAGAPARQAGPPPAPQSSPAATAFALPTDLEATIDITADAITWRDGLVRQAVARAALADGALMVNQMSAQLPGNSAVSAQGVLRSPEGVARAELTVEATSDNLRAVLEWLRFDVAAVPGGRLGRFQAAATVEGTAEELAVRGLDATIDTTSLRGAATVRPGGGDQRLAVGATVKVGSLNLDAYLPPPGAVPAQQPAMGGTATAPQPAGKDAAAEPLLAGLEMLNDVDANVRADIETLTLRDVPMHDVRLDLALQGGVLTLKDSGVGQVLGASGRLSGGLTGFGGEAEFRDLAYTVRVPDVAKLARAFAVTLPVPAAQVGQVALDGRISGTLKALQIDTDSRLLGAAMSARGTLADVLGAVSADLAVQAAHPDMARLLAAVAPTVRLTGPLGAFALKGQVKASAGSVAMTGMTLGVGDTRLEGDVMTDLAAAPRPLVTATLRANALSIDRFLPAEQRAWLEPIIAPLRSMIVPAAFVPGRPDMASSPVGVIPAQARRPAPRRQQVAGPWSTEPLDLSGLGMVNARVTLDAGMLSWQNVVLQQARVATVLQDATLTVNQLSGSLFGGSLSGTGSVNASGAVPAMTVALEGNAVQLGQALTALSGKATADGVAAFTTTLNGSGESTLALAESLAGSGSLTVERLNVAAGQAGGQGASQALLGPVGALNKLASLGAGRDSLAQVAGTFTVDKGVATFQSLKLDSALYNGQFQGIVNLPRWTLDVQGQARLAPNLLTSLLGSRVRLPDVIPIAVTGSLDDPIVRMQTGQAAPVEGAAPAAPAPATPEGAARQLLDQVLGGSQQRQTPPPAEAPAEQQ
ncbi:MAG: AsmA family protein, partial [Rhodospirillaceae bacterium]